MTDVKQLFDLTGKVAIVTGGNQGIGWGIARALSGAGASLVIANRHADTGNSAALRLEAMGGRAMAIQADVAVAADVDRLIARTLEYSGRLDILVNNAGIVRRGPISEMTEAEWDKVLDTNLKGAWLCARAASRPMLDQRYGRIINISSLNSVRAGGYKVAYCTSKAGLSQLTRALAVEWGSHGITVNAIAPGLIMNERTRGLFSGKEDQLSRIIDGIPLGRPGELEDLAGIALFLASDASAYVTGQVIFLDGGRSLV